MGARPVKDSLSYKVETSNIVELVCVPVGTLAQTLGVNLMSTAGFDVPQLRDEPCSPPEHEHSPGPHLLRLLL